MSGLKIVPHEKGGGIRLGHGEISYYMGDGVYSRHDVSLGLDGIDAWGSSADDDDMAWAFDIVKNWMVDRSFGTSGHRNDGTVNVSIALWVLGYDPYEWWDRYFGLRKLDWYDEMEWQKHVDRITYDDCWPRIWGPDGHEGEALMYLR